ncbi:Nicotinamidase [Streptococcus oralis]|uniref:Nicotinamidase n=1 Tax=Streptococcus oralis TaxID=1303 RepID=A0A139QZW0_STROR|nr:Nicotinamidase [Streptococcus oralis]
MAKALISIDYTEDFVADHGKLTAGAPAQAISKAIDQVTRLAFDRGDYVFFTIDAHEEKDTSTQKASSFHHTTSSELVGVTFMDP